MAAVRTHTNTHTHARTHARTERARLDSGRLERNKGMELERMYREIKEISFICHLFLAIFFFLVIRTHNSIYVLLSKKSVIRTHASIYVLISKNSVTRTHTPYMFL